MSSLNTYFFHNCLRTRVEQLKITLDGSQQQIINGELQTDIAVIYGISTYTDGVAYDNSPLISTAQSESLFLNVKRGKVFTVQNLKLSDLNNEFAGSPLIRTEKYTPMIIYREDFVLSASYIANPLLIGATGTPPNIILNFWYVDQEDWETMLGHGMVFNPEHPNYKKMYPYDREASKAAQQKEKKK